MSIAKIISEIDAYLLCLRQARDLLAGPNGVAGRPNAAHKQARAEVTKKTSTSAKAARLRKVQLRRESVQLKADAESKAVDLVVTRLDSALHKTGVIEMMPVRSGASVPQDVQLPVRRDRSQDAGLQRREQQKQAAAVESAKPARMLAGSAHLRVVVVSAEEAQKARKQTEYSAARHYRTPATPQSGRLAFEALFKDEADSAAAPSV
jgi:hypothetical protein